jgi:predicted nucleic acid-binding protein
MVLRGDVDLVLSQLVLEETRRNLAESAPKSLSFLEFVLESVPYEIVRPSKRQVLAAAEYTAFKDAPIAAAAKMAKVELLVTLDRKHLLDRPDLARHVGADIVTPKEVVEMIRRAAEN